MLNQAHVLGFRTRLQVFKTIALKRERSDYPCGAADSEMISCGTQVHRKHGGRDAISAPEIGDPALSVHKRIDSEIPFSYYLT